MAASKPIYLLPVLAALSAFTLPPAKTGVRLGVASLFAPVAWPTRTVGLAVHERLFPDTSRDLLSPDNPRTAKELRQQNQALINQVANLQAQLDDLKRISAQYDKLGTDLRRLIEPATVTGGPTDQRQTLTIATSNLSQVREGMAVVVPQGYIGRIESVSPGFARVLLVNDPSSTVQVRFAEFLTGQDGQIEVATVPIDQPLVSGQSKPQVRGGLRKLVAGYLPPRQVRGKLKPGDAVLLDEPNLPPVLKGLRVGTVGRVDVPPTNADYATVTIDPVVDFSTLHEVLVVTR